MIIILMSRRYKWFMTRRVPDNSWSDWTYTRWMRRIGKRLWQETRIVQLSERQAQTALKYDKISIDGVIITRYNASTTYREPRNYYPPTIYDTTSIVGVE